MTVLALHRQSMESTHGEPASTVGPLAAVALVLGTVLFMATISLGVMIMLNTAGVVLRPPCAEWPINALPC